MFNPVNSSVRALQSSPQDRPQDRPKDRKIAAILAFIGAIPLPGIHTPIAGLHKFYLGQPRWGLVYLALCFTPIPAIASILEGLWYLFQDRGEFDHLFNLTVTERKTEAIATQRNQAADLSKGIANAVRDLDQLRQEGLISEYEFEQKRRQILDKV